MLQQFKRFNRNTSSNNIILTLWNSDENKGFWLKFVHELSTWKFSPLTRADQQEFPSRPDTVIFTVCIQGKAFFIPTVSQQINFHFRWALTYVLWHCFNCLNEYRCLVILQTFSYKVLTSILTFPHSSLISLHFAKELGFPALSFVHTTNWPTSLSTLQCISKNCVVFCSDESK